MSYDLTATLESIRAGIRPVWLNLTYKTDPADDDPAIQIYPIDWTEHERLRQLSLEPYEVNGKREMAINNALFLRYLVAATRPDDWRGFTKGNEPLPFQRDLLLDVLTKNILLGMKFIHEVTQHTAKIGLVREDERKNSNAGHGTPDISRPATME